MAKTIKERLTAVEVELKNLNKSFDEFKKLCKENFKEIANQIDEKFDNFNPGRMSGKETASIIAAVIVSVAGIIIAWVK